MSQHDLARDADREGHQEVTNTTHGDEEVNPTTTTTAEERAAALDRLMLSYAMAVDRLLHCIAAACDERGVDLDEMKAVAKEVRDMTDLHLTPTPM